MRIREASSTFSPKPNAPVAAGNIPADNLPTGNISAGNADAAATAETSQTFAEKTLGGAGQDSNQLGQANAQDAPAIPKEKSLVDYLMFWRANGKSKNSSAPDAAEALTAATLPEIAAPGESNAKKDGAPDAAEEPENAVAAARAEEAAGELKTISNPPRDRIKFLTQSTSRLKAKAAPPPQPAPGALVPEEASLYTEEFSLPSQEEYAPGYDDEYESEYDQQGYGPADDQDLYYDDDYYDEGDEYEYEPEPEPYVPPRQPEPPRSQPAPSADQEATRQFDTEEILREALRYTDEDFH